MLDRHEELRSLSAVGDAMVGREGDFHELAYSDRSVTGQMAAA